MTRFGPFPTRESAEAFAAALNQPLETRIVKTETERRFTFGPLYLPGETDAHNQTIKAETLQEAVWQWMAKGDRNIRLQHSAIVAGTMVELATWPHEHEATFMKADGTAETRMMPRDTPYIGVRWRPWAWDLVKEGRITGMSLAGTARVLGS